MFSLLKQHISTICRLINIPLTCDRFLRRSTLGLPMKASPFGIIRNMHFRIGEFTELLDRFKIRGSQIGCRNYLQFAAIGSKLSQLDQLY